MITGWKVSNFKSIRDGDDLPLGPLTIFAEQIAAARVPSFSLFYSSRKPCRTMSARGR